MEKDPEKLKRDAEVLRMGYTPNIQSVPTESGEPTLAEIRELIHRFVCPSDYAVNPGDAPAAILKLFREKSTPPVQSCKTLQEVKDEVARKYNFNSWSDLYFGEALNKAMLDDLCEIYASQFQSSSKEWISVEDRLPEDTEHFLSCNTRSMGLMHVCWYNRVHKHYCYSGGKYDGTKENPYFTHWMPLPQPPRWQYT